MNLLFCLFGCRHKHITFPLRKQQIYVVCLDCAREFDYDWQSMKIGKQRVAKRYRAPVEVQPIPEPKISTCQSTEELERMVRLK